MSRPDINLTNPNRRCDYAPTSMVERSDSKGHSLLSLSVSRSVTVGYLRSPETDFLESSRSIDDSVVPRVQGWSQEILLGRVKALQGGQIFKNFFKSWIFAYILPIFLIPRGVMTPPDPPLGPSLLIRNKVLLIVLLKS